MNKHIGGESCELDKVCEPCEWTVMDRETVGCFHYHVSLRVGEWTY